MAKYYLICVDYVNFLMNYSSCNCWGIPTRVRGAAGARTAEFFQRAAFNVGAPFADADRAGHLGSVQVALVIRHRGGTEFASDLLSTAFSVITVSALLVLLRVS